MDRVTKNIINQVIDNNETLVKLFERGKKDIVKKCKKQENIPTIKAYQDGIQNGIEMCVESVRQINENLSNSIKEK